MSTTNPIATRTYQVTVRSVKSNGRPFPYQHDEVTRYWVTKSNLLTTERSEAAHYATRREANHVAWMMSGTVESHQKENEEMKTTIATRTTTCPRDTRQVHY